MSVMSKKTNLLAYKIFWLHIAFCHKLKQKKKQLGIKFDFVLNPFRVHHAKHFTLTRS